jgi:diguanylate cyclase (GGDEF)-like protein
MPPLPQGPAAIEAARHQAPPPAWLALLAGLGVLLNAWPVPLFYGVHLLLGSVPATLALLLWRTWWAVPLGLLAGLQTWRLWGHPWAVLIFTLELAWLTLALRRFNGPPGSDGNGRVVLFSMAYWLLLGCPLVFLTYGLLMGIDPANVVVVAVKQAFNGVFNTVVAFCILILVLGLQSQRQRGPGVSLRGVIVATTLLAITLPSLLTSLEAGHQLEIAVQSGALDGLRTVNLAISRASSRDENTRLLMDQLGEAMAYRRINADGRNLSSNAALFHRLDSEFRDSGRQNVHLSELALLIPRTKGPALRKWVNGYWSYSRQYEAGDGSTYLVQVVEPSRAVVIRMQEQSTKLLLMTFAVVLAGTGSGLWLGRRFEREFSDVLRPLEQQGDQIQPLRLSALIELRDLATLINHRLLQVNRLSSRLRQANTTLRQSRRELKELLQCDPLTGCGNRAALDQRLQEEVDRCSRSGEALSCLVIHATDLAVIRREHGRQAADALTLGLAQAAQRRLRRTDHLYRWQDDGFVVLAIGCWADDARSLAGLLQEAMNAVHLTPTTTVGPVVSQDLRTRVWIGRSTLESEQDSADALMRRAADGLPGPSSRV